MEDVSVPAASSSKAAGSKTNTRKPMVQTTMQFGHVELLEHSWQAEDMSTIELENQFSSNINIVDDAPAAGGGGSKTAPAGKRPRAETLSPQKSPGARPPKKAPRTTANRSASGRSSPTAGPSTRSRSKAATKGKGPEVVVAAAAASKPAAKKAAGKGKGKQKNAITPA